MARRVAQKMFLNNIIYINNKFHSDSTQCQHSAKTLSITALCLSTMEKTVAKLWHSGSEIVQKLFRSFAETVPKLCQNCGEIVPKICRKCAETVPNLCKTVAKRAKTDKL